MVFEENTITVIDEFGRPKKKSTWENKASLFHSNECAEDLKFCPKIRGSANLF
jgi:hypothetical protein